MQFSRKLKNAFSFFIRKSSRVNRNSRRAHFVAIRVLRTINESNYFPISLSVQQKHSAREMRVK